MLNSTFTFMRKRQARLFHSNIFFMMMMMIEIPIHKCFVALGILVLKCDFCLLLNKVFCGFLEIVIFRSDSNLGVRSFRAERNRLSRDETQRHLLLSSRLRASRPIKSSRPHEVIKSIGQVLSIYDWGSSNAIPVKSSGQ